MKWITEKDINNWSVSFPRQAQSELPELVRDLIIASVKPRELAKCEISFGNSISKRGYDGEVEVRDIEKHRFIPVGNSVWEIKTSKNYKSEIKDDLKKRSQKTPADKKIKNTIVLVTSKSWTTGDKSECVEAWKEEFGDWQDIKCIDANGLEAWLEMHPTVAKRYAYKISKIPTDKVYDIDEFWEKFNSRYDLEITHSAALASREIQKKELFSNFVNEVKFMEYAADSTDEAKAFIISAIKTLEDESYKTYLENKLLVVENEAFLEKIYDLANISSLIILLPAKFARNFMALTNKHTLISIDARKIPHRIGDLPRSNIFDFSKALSESNPQESEESMNKLAHECGGSLTILERRRPSSTNREIPNWARSDNVPLLMPALLAGAWDESREGDKEILALLSDGDDYDNFEGKFKAILHEEGLPIDYLEPITKMVAPIDTFSLIPQNLTNKRYKNLKKAALKIFMNKENIKDPTAEIQYGIRTEEPNKSGYGKYSEWLSNGIANTLLIIANMHRELNLPTPPSPNHKEYIDNIITSFPELQNDINFMKSLEGKLTYLMEAAPDSLLEALESLLKNSPDNVAEIFEAEEGFLSPNYKHTNLLWALETIAWDPNYLERVCLILTDLASIAPEIKIINSPLNSLREILLPWHPSTNADSKQRLKVLDSIIIRNSVIAWELITSLLPSYRGHASSTHKPIYRKSGEDKKENLTRGIVWNTWEHVLNCAYELAGNDSEKWNTILLESNFQKIQKKGIQEALINKLEFAIRNMDCHEKTKLWNFLREFIYKNYSYPKKFGVTPPYLKKIEKLLSDIEPDNLIENSRWLFANYDPVFPERDYDKKRKKIYKLRQDAIKSIYDKYSTDGILELAKSINQSSCEDILAHMCMKYVESIQEAINLIKENYESNEDIKLFVMYFAAQVKHNNRFENWNLEIKNLIENSNWSTSAKADLLKFWPNKRSAWDFIESFDSEISSHYWREKSHISPYDLDVEDIEFASNKLLDNNSFFLAIQAISEQANKINLELIIKSLGGAIAEVNKRKNIDQMFSYYVEKIFSALTKRNDIEPPTLARMEFCYMNLLKDENIDLSIYKIMRTDPVFYVSVVDAAYKKDNFSEDDDEIASDERISLAENAWTIFRAFRSQKINIEYLINNEKLMEWSNEVIKLAEDIGKADSARITIAQLIAHAPLDPDDNIWPHKSVRDLLEHLNSEDVNVSMSIEKSNSEGAKWTSVDAGGEESRDEAKEYRKLAESLEEWRNTSKLYKIMAESKEQWAKIKDNEVRLRKMKNS